MNVREKKKPHYSLPKTKALIEAGKVHATRTALEGAAELVHAVSPFTTMTNRPGSVD
jgi:hypothetical protein